VAAALLLLAPTVAAFRSGDVTPFGQELILMAAVALAVLGMLAVAAPWPLVERGPGILAAAALAGLAAWAALSLLWAPVFALAKPDVVRAVLYAACLGTGLIALRPSPIRRAVPPALLAGISAVALYGLGQRMLPGLGDALDDLLPDLVGYRAGAGSRLDAPVGYWNAMGLLMAFGCLLGTALASDPGRRTLTRALACAAVAPCGLALYMTLSRGAVLALGTGLLVLVLVRPAARTLLAGALGLGIAGALVLAVQAFPAVTDLTLPESDRKSEGALMVGLVAAAMLAAALALPRLERVRLYARELPLARHTPPWVVVAAVAAVAAVGAVVVLSAERTELAGGSTERLGTLKTLRGDYWAVAVRSFAENPLLGVGAGGFEVEWRRERESLTYTRDAHSVYLETLAELGIVGGLLLAAFLAALAVALARRRRDDPLVAAAAPVLAAFAVHAGVDVDWERPALVLPVLILAAAVFQPRS
jgi:O-antigen ligase